jgi:hypothetical protein
MLWYIGCSERTGEGGGGGMTWHFGVYPVDDFCCLCTTIPITFYILYTHSITSNMASADLEKDPFYLR